LTPVEVAARTGTSKVTARRNLDSSRFTNAIREDGRSNGRWLDPWSDVLAPGLARKKLLGAATAEHTPSVLHAFRRDNASHQAMESVATGILCGLNVDDAE
jgi:hypothetical protein